MIFECSKCDNKKDLKLSIHDSFPSSLPCSHCGGVMYTPDIPVTNAWKMEHESAERECQRIDEEVKRASNMASDLARLLAAADRVTFRQREQMATNQDVRELAEALEPWREHISLKTPKPDKPKPKPIIKQTWVADQLDSGQVVIVAVPDGGGIDDGVELLTMIETETDEEAVLAQHIAHIHNQSIHKIEKKKGQLERRAMLMLTLGTANNDNRAALRRGDEKQIAATAGARDAAMQDVNDYMKELEAACP